MGRAEAVSEGGGSEELRVACQDRSELCDKGGGDRGPVTGDLGSHAAGVRLHPRGRRDPGGRGGPRPSSYREDRVGGGAGIGRLWEVLSAAGGRCTGPRGPRRGRRRPRSREAGGGGADKGTRHLLALSSFSRLLMTSCFRCQALSRGRGLRLSQTRWQEGVADTPLMVRGTEAQCQLRRYREVRGAESVRGDFLDSVTAELRFKMEAGVSQLSSQGGREEGEPCSRQGGEAGGQGGSAVIPGEEAGPWAEARVTGL